MTRPALAGPAGHAMTVPVARAGRFAPKPPLTARKSPLPARKPSLIAPKSRMSALEPR